MKKEIKASKIISVKITDLEVIIQYSDGTNIYTVESFETPLDSFRKALQGLKSSLNKICELDHSSNCVVKKVTLKNKGEDEAVIITATRELLTGHTLLINTPLFEESLWDSDLVEQVDLLVDEAKKFVRGETAIKQTVLFDKDY